MSAKDLGTGKEQRVTITASTHLDKAQVERMVREAERNAAEGQRRREQIEARNRADSLVYATEKGLKDYGDKVSPEDRTNIETARIALKEAVAGEDVERIKTLSQELEQASYKMAEAMYAGARQTTEPPIYEETATKTDAAKGSDVIDAEFRATQDS